MLKVCECSVKSLTLTGIPSIMGLTIEWCADLGSICIYKYERYVMTWLFL